MLLTDSEVRTYPLTSVNEGFGLLDPPRPQLGLLGPVGQGGL